MTAVRALVTGGSGDIGRAVCHRLCGLGYHVIVHAHRRATEADALAAELTAAGPGSGEAVAFDVGDPDASREAVERLLEAGPIQVLVNNAGTHEDAPMAGMRAEQWRRIVEVNLNGFFHVTQPLLLPMIRRRWGRIVSVSSVAAVIGNRGQTNYAAAKAGLHGATRSLALELASRGITVNAVAPGIVSGALTQELFDRDTIRRLVPMQRAAEPAEVADLIAFLSSERAGYITGEVISINGGMGA